jgi:hypothetical protein
MQQTAEKWWLLSRAGINAADSKKAEQGEQACPAGVEAQQTAAHDR